VFEEKTSLKSFYLAPAIIFPALYGFFYYLSVFYSPNFFIFCYGIFFINNAWFLIYLRNAVINYNEDIMIGRYFLWTIVSLVLPISLIIFFNPTEVFTQIIFSTAYFIGIFPMTIFVAILLGVSVNSVFWGVFASVSFFSIDFAIRSSLIIGIPEDYLLVISELFRASFITLCFVISLFGNSVERKRKEEIIEGTKKLNNILFMLLTIFPVMIFYVSFWQVNLNHEKLQQNEFEVSKEILRLSTEKLENYSEKYTKMIEDVMKSSSIASAQWKVGSYKFSNPEIENAQIITYSSNPFDGINILLKTDTIEYSSNSDKGWGIKLTVNKNKIYNDLPLNEKHSLFVFEDQTPILYPFGYNISRSELTFTNSYQYAYETPLTLFGKSTDVVLVFQTSSPQISQFTMYFMFFAIFLLVLIWAFYGYYMGNWERKAKKTILNIREKNEETEKKMENMRHSLNYMSKDISKNELQSEELFERNSYLIDFLRNQSFQQGSEIALSFFFRKLKAKMNGIEELYLIRKSISTYHVYACSDSSTNGKICEIKKMTDKVSDITYQLRLNNIFYHVSGIEDSEYLLFLRKREDEVQFYKESEFLADLLNISELYIRQQNLLKRNENVFDKTLAVIKLLDRIKSEKPFTETWKKTILENIRSVVNNPVFMGIFTVSDDDIRISILEKDQLQTVSVEDEDHVLLLKLKTETPAFENISPSESFSKDARSYGILPFYFKNKIIGIYMEYTDYRIFSQREIELFFFIAKNISSLKE